MTVFRVALVIDVPDALITPEDMIEAWRLLANRASEGVRILDVEAVELT